MDNRGTCIAHGNFQLYFFACSIPFLKQRSVTYGEFTLLGMDSTIFGQELGRVSGCQPRPRRAGTTEMSWAHQDRVQTPAARNQVSSPQDNYGKKGTHPSPQPPPPTHTHRETRGPGQSRTPGGPGGGEWPSPDRKTLCKATGRVLGLCTRQGDPGPAVVRRLTVLQERLHGRRHCCGTRSPTACHGNCAVSTFHVGKCRVDDVLQSPRPPSDAESRRRPTCPARVSLET